MRITVRIFIIVVTIIITIIIRITIIIISWLIPATVFNVPLNFEKRSCRCGGVLISVYFGSTQMTRLFCVLCGRRCSKRFTRVCCVLRCVGLRTVNTE